MKLARGSKRKRSSDGTQQIQALIQWHGKQPLKRIDSPQNRHAINQAPPPYSSSEIAFV
jgi:hypothetical protein